jgi:hypothetical protein
MKKENLLLLINTVFMLMIGLLAVLIVNRLVPNDPQDFLFNQVVELENKVIIEPIPVTNSYSIVNTSENAVNRSGDKIATVYNIKIKNGYTYSDDYQNGFIELLVAIDESDKVYVEIVTLNQSNWTVNGIQNYIYTYYQGIDYRTIENIQDYDAAAITAGATATDSTGAIRDLIQRAIDIHYGLVVEEPFIGWYGEGYTLTNDPAFTPSTYVLSKQIVTNASDVVLGYVYKLTNRGEYYDGEVGSVSMYLGFDTLDEVVGVLLPQDEYQHSLGARYTNTVTYVNLLVGLSVDEFETVIGANGDITAGASNTRNIVDTMLNAFISEVN